VDHGGALVDFAENVSRGHDHWREPYIAQGDQKKQQLDLMLRYAESSECRMAALVRHFGDLADSRKACGICDFCAPPSAPGSVFVRPPIGSAWRPSRWWSRYVPVAPDRPANCTPRSAPAPR